MRRISIAAAVLLASMCRLAGEAMAEHANRHHPAKTVVLGYYGDQRGCYWAEGRRYCARYCYWDVDGVRYCQEHRRLAYPQGDPWYVSYPAEPRIYPRHRRAR